MGAVKALRAAIVLALAVATSAASARARGDGRDQWPSYGGDPGGTRYSPVAQITRTNVSGLARAWSY